jgi:hypothetical protein
MGLSPAGRARRYVPALRRLLFRLATSDTYERLVRPCLRSRRRPAAVAAAPGGSWGGRYLSVGDYVMGTGATTGGERRRRVLMFPTL